MQLIGKTISTCEPILKTDEQVRRASQDNVNLSKMTIRRGKFPNLYNRVVMNCGTPTE